MDSVAWYDGNSNNKTHLVGSKAPNELGIYYMNGNVWEWCQDWCGSYSSDSQINPTGNPSGSIRVLRGSCWFNYVKNCYISYRAGAILAECRSHAGFRLILVQ